MAYRRDRGVDVGIVRIFNTYGERMRPDDGRAIPTFISQALRGEPITVHGSGTQTRSICHVSDLVRGILLLLDSGETGPINCGTEHEMTMLELADTIVRLSDSARRCRCTPAPPTTPSAAAPTSARPVSCSDTQPTVGPRKGCAGPWTTSAPR